MMNLIQAILAAFLRRPATTDAIVTVLTKTVAKLETHADTTNAKVDAQLAQAGALVDAAMTLKDDVEKARSVAKNLGALLK